MEGIYSMKENKCVDCEQITKYKCEVCGRAICLKCTVFNHEKFNFEKTENDKLICDYCASLYWRGF